MALHEPTLSDAEFEADLEQLKRLSEFVLTLVPFMDDAVQLEAWKDLVTTMPVAPPGL